MLVRLLVLCFCVNLAVAVPTAQRRRKPAPPAPSPPNPQFDGIMRPSLDDPARLDAYMKAPKCPSGIKACEASSNHCNFLEKIPGGMAVAWFSGYREGWDKTAIVMARRADNSTQWSDPALVSEQEGFSAQNPILYADTNASVLYAFHTRQPKGNSDQGLLDSDPVPSQERLGVMWLSRSTDWGRTWAAAELWEGELGTWGRNRLLRGLDSSWMLPLYNESLKPLGHSYEHSLMLRKAPGAPVQPVTSWTEGSVGQNSSYLVQPSVIRLEEGKPHLRAFFRDRRAMWIYTATSDDDGRQWSDVQATSLPNNNVGIQATVLQSGAVAIVFNNMQGQTKGNLRNILAIALSDDQGKTFAACRILENHPATALHDDVGHSMSRLGGVGPTSCNCYSYPTIVQTDDGKVHVGYTYQRRTIKITTVNESWIRDEHGEKCAKF